MAAPETISFICLQPHIFTVFSGRAALATFETFNQRRHEPTKDNDKDNRNFRGKDESMKKTPSKSDPRDLFVTSVIK